MIKATKKTYLKFIIAHSALLLVQAISYRRAGSLVSIIGGVWGYVCLCLAYWNYYHVEESPIR